jgi:hypothetical protein
MATTRVKKDPGLGASSTTLLMTTDSFQIVRFNIHDFCPQLGCDQCEPGP